MKYRIIFTRRALKDWEKVPKEVRERIGEKLRAYSEDPFAYARKLISPKIGSYGFRIGDYRVIADIEGDEIVVLRVGHRRDIYQ
ncbi:MAG: type II toxin-antitoxin system RelE/ParE family toxin [Candidatus Latescibacterota bacterium]|nr:MAG: type II toxin-antitoxin system RelE/ParE family toxin [Candidatus Latescibacterota bacterium]